MCIVSAALSAYSIIAFMGGMAIGFLLLKMTDVVIGMPYPLLFVLQIIIPLVSVVLGYLAGRGYLRSRAAS